MVTSAVLMRLAEVAERNRAVDGPNDHADRDLGRVTSHHVPAPDAALGSDQSGPLEREQDLLEVRLGQTCALCDVAH